MGKHTGHRRLVRGIGGFLSAALIASGLAVTLGGGVASAQAASGTAGVALWDDQTPSLLQQNTRGYGYNDDPISGAGAAWVLRIGGDWKAGDTYAISVVPNSIPLNIGGGNCGTPIIPPGVNQSTIDFANYIGFVDPNNEGRVDDGPILWESTFGAGEAPQIYFGVDDGIGCTGAPVGPTGDKTYATLLIILDNDGNGNAAQTAEIVLGKSFDNDTGWEDGPVLFDVGYGATTGPAAFKGFFCPGDDDGNPVVCEKGSRSAAAEQWVNATETFTVASSVTVTGQRPSANNPRTTLVRDTRSDLVSGPISEFKISENVFNALPPPDGYAPEGSPGCDEADDCSDPDDNRHIITYGDGNPQGAVCLRIDHGAGSNDIEFGETLPTWGVDPGASVTPNSARSGPGQVVLEDPDLLRLPVEDSSNVTPTRWTTTGLNLTGTAYADGPVYAWVYYIYEENLGDDEKGTYSCADAWDDATFDRQAFGASDNAPQLLTQLGYVQLATVSEVATPIAGATAVDTAAEAIEHQFDYSKGHCVGTLYFDDANQGGAIFLARDDHFADGLGAAYSAGSVDTGVLLTNPAKLSSAAKQAIRRQGVQTIYIVGGNLAVSDAVEAELAATTAYLCGGNQPRLDDDSGKPKKLVVERVAGQTLWDTNQLLAEFSGAQNPMAFGAFGLWTSATPDVFNNTTARSLVGTAPTRPVNTALLVTGENFQDAMVGSVPAYGGDWYCGQDWCPDDALGRPMPLIATATNSLTPQAIDAMRNQSIRQLIVVGGPMAVSESVVDQAVAAIPGLGVIRVAGQTASDTSVQLAEFELSYKLGMGWRNSDFDWDMYVNRTAGDINQNDCNMAPSDLGSAESSSNECITARTVLMARGDYFADAMAAAPVLSVHNGRWDNAQKFPLITTESPTSLGVPVITFLVRASFWNSFLDGGFPSGTFAGGLGILNNVNGGAGEPIYCSSNGSYVLPGCNVTTPSSSVFTIQPIGGDLALSPALLDQAGKWLGGNGLPDLGAS